MEDIVSHVPTEDELKELNPDGIDIDMDLLAQMVEEDQIQDSFNEDDVMGNYDENGSLNMEGVEEYA